MSIIETIKNVNEKTEVVIVTKKAEKLLKKNRVTKEQCPYAEVVKDSIIEGYVGKSYKDIINEELVAKNKAADFEPNSLPFGEWIENSNTIIKHKDKYYLRFYTDDTHKRTTKYYRCNR